MRYFSLLPSSVTSLTSLLALMCVLGCGDAQSVAPRVAPPVVAAPTEIPAVPNVAPTPPATEQDELFAIIETASGRVKIKLETKRAPRLCANFANLVDHKFYDGARWTGHTFVVRQTSGVDGVKIPDYSIRPEYSKDLLFNEGGMVGMAKLADGPNQPIRPTTFFLTIKGQERWNLDYPIFATIVEGISVAKNITKDERITTIRLEGDPTPLYTRFAKDRAVWNAALES